MTPEQQMILEMMNKRMDRSDELMNQRFTSLENKLKPIEVTYWKNIGIQVAAAFVWATLIQGLMIYLKLKS